MFDIGQDTLAFTPDLIITVCWEVIFLTQEFHHLCLGSVVNNSGCGSGVDLQKWKQFYFSKTNGVFGLSLLFCISLHVGILARWVHLGDNIHGYIPLSIPVLARRVTVDW